MIGTQQFRKYGEGEAGAPERVIQHGRGVAEYQSSAAARLSGGRAAAGLGGGLREVRSTGHNRWSTHPVIEQMVSRLHHLAATVAPSNELGAQPRQPPAPSEDVQAPAEPLREQAAERTEPEPDHDHHSGETTKPEVVVGSLRTTQEDI
jgi:hypothetical protein